jgi:integrase
MVTKAMDRDVYVCVLLEGDAGLRVGETMALEWTDVDLVNRVVCVQKSDWQGQVTAPKGGEKCSLPLTDRLVAALREHRHLRGPRVLYNGDQPFTRATLQGRVKKAATAAGLQHKGIHICRHSFCTHRMMDGVPRSVVQAMMRHKQLRMTEQYTHVPPAAMEAAIGLMNKRAVAGERGNILATADDPAAKLNG